MQTGHTFQKAERTYQRIVQNRINSGFIKTYLIFSSSARFLEMPSFYPFLSLQEGISILRSKALSFFSRSRENGDSPRHPFANARQ